MSHPHQPVAHVAAAKVAALGLPKLNDYARGGSGGSARARGGRSSGGGMRGGRASFGASSSSSTKPVRKRTLERQLARAKGTNRQADRQSGLLIGQAAKVADAKARTKLRMDVAAAGGDIAAIPKKLLKAPRSSQPPVKKARLLPSATAPQTTTPEMLMSGNRVDENGERPWDIDEEMRFYEQQLGVRRLKKKKAAAKAAAAAAGNASGDESDDAELDTGALSKLRSELAEDGLGDLFDFVNLLESGGDGNGDVPLEEAGFEEFDRNDPDNRSDDEEDAAAAAPSGSKKAAAGTTAEGYSLTKAQRILAAEAEIDRKQTEIEEALNKSMRRAKEKAERQKAKLRADEDEAMSDDTPAAATSKSRKRARSEDEDEANEESVDEDGDSGDDDRDSEDADSADEDDALGDESAEDEEMADEDEDDQAADATDAAEPSATKKPFDLYGFTAPTPDSLLAFRRGEKNILAASSSSSDAAAASTAATAAASTAAAPAKYIPPHLRAAAAAAAAATGTGSTSAASAAANAAKQAALRRQLKGLLNRLTSANLENIALQIQSSLYSTHSKREVTDVLCEELLGLCTVEADGTSGGYAVGSNSSTLLASAALVVYLHATIGQDIGAHFLEKFVLAFRDHNEQSTAARTGQQAAHALKACSTLITFITYLYNLDLLSSNLIYELVRKFVDEFRSDSIELLLIVLQNCGYQLRKDDPQALKEIILLVQAKAKQATAKKSAASANKSTPVDAAPAIPESRVAFMLDMIYDLKNNKKRHSSIFESIQPLQNWLAGKLKRKKLADGGELQLRFGWNDILNIESRGRWWLVGSAWKGKRNGESEEKTGSAAGASAAKSSRVSLPAEESTDSVDLLSLARSQHMNTDLRKSLFLIVMSAVDYMDAYEKICKLNLAPAQVRQVVKVLLDCCANEGKYNPYYSYLALQLCRMDGGKELKFTLQLALWDAAKEWTDESLQKEVRAKNLRGDAKDAFLASKNRQALNLSKFLALLLRETTGGGLTLNWFKAIDFHRLSGLQLLFLTSCFKDLLLHADVPHLNATMLRLNTQIFEKKKSGAAASASRSEEFQLLRDGIDYFMQHHLTPTAQAMHTNAKTKEQGAILKQRIAMARKAMQGQVDQDWMFAK